LEESWDLEFLWTDAIEGGEKSSQYMIFSPEGGGAFKA